MKIRYMKNKVKRHLNLKYEEISIHFFYMYIRIHAKFIFDKYKIKKKKKKDLI